jgi:hypothetical protein
MIVSMKRDRVSTSHRSRRRSATATRARSLRAAKENGHGGAHLEQERRRTPPAVVATEGVRIPMRCTSTIGALNGRRALRRAAPRLRLRVATPLSCERSRQRSASTGSRRRGCLPTPARCGGVVESGWPRRSSRRRFSTRWPSLHRSFDVGEGINEAHFP